ncbi:YodC family protein [Stutzerimonas tarimensis]|uniref:YodC family protein n=1 Tax=Stutzerimonas tarimensis TaxID=1507735 RepID=A0ABV7T376_9GAMM
MARQNEFKIGDIVKLKSGGPEMTVQQAPTDTSTYYKCQWFAGKKLESGVFPEGSLESAK